MLPIHSPVSKELRAICYYNKISSYEILRKYIANSTVNAFYSTHDTWSTGKPSFNKIQFSNSQTNLLVELLTKGRKLAMGEDVTVCASCKQTYGGVKSCVQCVYCDTESVKMLKCEESIRESQLGDAKCAALNSGNESPAVAPSDNLQLHQKMKLLELQLSIW